MQETGRFSIRYTVLEGVFPDRLAHAPLNTAIPAIATHSHCPPPRRGRDEAAIAAGWWGCSTSREKSVCVTRELCYYFPDNCKNTAVVSVLLAGVTITPGVKQKTKTQRVTEW